MENGNQIKMELLPKAAPNTVNSFLWAARKGVFDGHVIERIVPKDWIDVSYTGFQKREGQYLIPWEYTLNPQITPLDSDFGWVCMAVNFSFPFVPVQSIRESILYSAGCWRGGRSCCA